MSFIERTIQKIVLGALMIRRSIDLRSNSKMLLEFINDFSIWSKTFPRWSIGACLAAPSSTTREQQARRFSPRFWCALWADRRAVHHRSEEGGPDSGPSAGYADTVELCHEGICMSARGS